MFRHARMLLSSYHWRSGSFTDVDIWTIDPSPASDWLSDLIMEQQNSRMWAVQKVRISSFAIISYLTSTLRHIHLFGGNGNMSQRSFNSSFWLSRRNQTQLRLICLFSRLWWGLRRPDTTHNFTHTSLKPPEGQLNATFNRLSQEQTLL